MTDTGIQHLPVVIVGGGPTGITAATLLAQYGVDSLILDRWRGVYPQPRAVHLDDEIYRVIARLGVADEFAAISRPTLGLRLLDNRFRVLAEFNRDPSSSRNGFPQANMFDQPELEALLRANLKRYPNAQLRGDAEVTDVTVSGRSIRVTFADRSDGRVHQVEADYLLGCDGANSIVRARIGSAMRDLNFQQRWLVVDVASDADLHQWDGVHQVCDPVRAGTYMRIGAARYRWEFRLLADESADDFGTLDALRPLIAPWTETVDVSDLTTAARHRVHVPRADRRPVAPREHLHPRRRGAPHSPVHRPGYGSGRARCGQSCVEDRRSAQRHAHRRRSGQLRAGTKAAHPAHDSAGAGCRPGDDRRRKRG